MSAPAGAGRAGLQQVAANAVALLLAYVIPRVFTVAAVVVAARVLGTSRFGAYGAAAALAVLLSVLASLGMHPLLVREMARAPERSGALIGAAHRLKAVSGLAMLVVAAALATRLFPGDGEARAAVLVLATGWVLQAFAENLSAYYQATERMRRWTEASALFGLVSASLGIALLLATGSLAAFSGGFVAGWGAALAWLLAGLPPEARPTARGGWDEARALARGTVPFAMAFVALTLYCKVDVLLLRQWSGDEQVGLYSAAYKFVDVFQALVIVAAGAAYPRLARTARARGSGRWAGARSTEVMILGSVPAGLTLYLVAQPLVLLLFGPAYAGAAPVLGWIGLLLPLLALSLHSAYVLGAAGRMRPVALLYALGVSANVAFNAWLIPHRGAEGAALARLGSETLLAAAFLVVVSRVADAAPRGRVVALAASVAGAAAALSALPDPSGGWLRGPLLLAIAAGVYAAAGAAHPGELGAVVAAVRGGAPRDAGEAT
ncbi:MAG: hypothetical protein AMXMBFR53_18020 [Gemmatimonadota bacterium]